MLKRLIVGLLIGLFVGGLLAVGIIKGLGMAAFVGGGGVALAYVAAALTGVLTGLVAGKPIWSSGGQIEAGLKAFFGALLAAGGMFALRQWVHVDVPNMTLPLIGEMHGEIGSLPLVALPLLGAILGGFYEADNTPEDKEKEKGKAAAPKKAALPEKGAKGANGKSRVAAPEDAAEADEELEAPSKRARR
jgi:hypothetical protein